MRHPILALFLVSCVHPGPGATVAAQHCVEPLADARRRMAARLDRDFDPRGLEVRELADLDGDRKHDWFIADALGCGTGGCAHEVYLARGTCGGWVGDLDFHDLMPRSERAGGLAVLDVRWDLGCCSRIESIASFDGQRYRERERTCNLDNTEPNADTWTCDAWHDAARR